MQDILISISNWPGFVLGAICALLVSTPFILLRKNLPMPKKMVLILTMVLAVLGGIIGGSLPNVIQNKYRSEITFAEIEQKHELFAFLFQSHPATKTIMLKELDNVFDSAKDEADAKLKIQALSTQLMSATFGKYMHAASMQNVTALIQHSLDTNNAIKSNPELCKVYELGMASPIKSQLPPELLSTELTIKTNLIKAAIVTPEITEIIKGEDLHSYIQQQFHENGRDATEIDALGALGTSTPEQTCTTLRNFYTSLLVIPAEQRTVIFKSMFLKNQP